MRLQSIRFVASSSAATSAKISAAISVAIFAAIFIFADCSIANSSSFSAGIVIGKTSKAKVSRARYTCYAAQTKLSLAGYRDIKTTKCAGSEYFFTAQLGSSTYKLLFKALTGKIQII